MWVEYRRIKLRLLVLLFGWLPFCLLAIVALPLIFLTELLGTVAVIVYMLVLAYTALQYALYPCPQCGGSLKGRQLYRETCPHCGTPINRPASLAK